MEGFDEVMLVTAFDHLVNDEKVARTFLARNAKL